MRPSGNLLWQSDFLIQPVAPPSRVGMHRGPRQTIRGILRGFPTREAAVLEGDDTMAILQASDGALEKLQGPPITEYSTAHVLRPSCPHSYLLAERNYLGLEKGQHSGHMSW